MLNMVLMMRRFSVTVLGMSCGVGGVVSFATGLNPCAPRLLSFTLGTRTTPFGYNVLPLPVKKRGPKHAPRFVSGLPNSPPFVNALLVQTTAREVA